MGTVGTVGTVRDGCGTEVTVGNSCNCGESPNRRLECMLECRETTKPFWWRWKCGVFDGENDLACDKPTPAASFQFSIQYPDRTHP